MGATQFALLSALGLPEDDRLLDIGCGSLRGGRLFITYLAEGGYTGIEPNCGLSRKVSSSSSALTSSRSSGLFFLTRASKRQAGAVHLYRRPIDRVTYRSSADSGPVRRCGRRAGTDRYRRDHFRPWPARLDRGGRKLPGVVRYRRQTIERWLAEAALEGVSLRSYHPRQTWWAIVHKGVEPPPRSLRFHARRAMLPFRRSWRVPALNRNAKRLCQIAPPRLRRTKLGRRIAIRLGGIGRYNIE